MHTRLQNDVQQMEKSEVLIRLTINLFKRTVHSEHSLDTEATNTTNTPVSTQIAVKQATEAVSARFPAGTIQ